MFYLLEDGFEVQLLNARHMRNVPGRKTDVADSEWIAKLIEHGLIRASFVPPEPIRQLRDLTRYRTVVVRERVREAQRLEKLLEDAGIKLSAVVSDILGKSARAMLEALVAGERRPQVLAELALGSMRGKKPLLAEALTGRFGAHHAFLVRAKLDRVDEADAMIARLNRQIETHAGGSLSSSDHPARRDTRDQHPRRGGDRGRDRCGHVPVSHRGTPGLLGRDVSRQRRVRRAPQIWHHSAR